MAKKLNDDHGLVEPQQIEGRADCCQFCGSFEFEFADTRAEGFVRGAHTLHGRTHLPGRGGGRDGGGGHFLPKRHGFGRGDGGHHDCVYGFSRSRLT